MKFTIITVVLLCTCLCLQAQKRDLSDTSYKNWLSVSRGYLSQDSKYAYYSLQKNYKDSAFIVKSTDSKWELCRLPCRNPTFSNSNKSLFILSRDSLIDIKLGTNEQKYIARCNGFQTLYLNNEEYLLINSLDGLNSMVILNVKTGFKQIIKDVKEYFFQRDNPNVIALKNNGQESVLEKINVLTGKRIKFYTGTNISGIIFSEKSDAIAFTTKFGTTTSLIYYNLKKSSPEIIGIDTPDKLASGMSISTGRIWSFDKSGENLFFTFNKTSQSVNKSKSPSIWNFRDEVLLPKSQTGMSDYYSNKNLAVVNINTKIIKQLASGPQYAASEVYGDKLIFKTDKVDTLNSENSLWRCDVKTGIISQVLKSTNYITSYSISPDSRFLFYYDPNSQNYFSVDLKSGIKKTILQLFKFRGRYEDSFRGTYDPVSVKAWIAGKEQVILQSAFDLLLLDLNTNVVKNLTENIGLKEERIFSLGVIPSIRIFDEDEKIILKSSNIKTKELTIYELRLKPISIKKIYTTDTYVGDFYGDIPSPYFQVRKNGYLFRFENVTNSPNFIFTRDFLKFDTISAVNNEQKYYWLTSEIHSYNDKLGRRCEGILYKSENLDTLKKHPVIFYYYLNQSDNLYQYKTPEPDGAGINIPYLTGKGYIVFVPNIYMEPRNPGEAALISVTAASEYLSKINWIDTSKMGLAGHSWGGFETNYIVSRTDKFKAAYSGAGVSNFIQLYNSEWLQGESLQGYLLMSPGYMENRMEEDPFSYINNSPILYTKKIHTPILLMHNNDDDANYVGQSRQFFIQLRSEKKPVWLLQYENEKHQVTDENNAVDLQNKITTFFDFYLRGSSEPTWMKEYFKINN